MPEGEPKTIGIEHRDVNEYSVEEDLRTDFFPLELPGPYELLGHHIHSGIGKERREMPIVRVADGTIWIGKEFLEQDGSDKLKRFEGERFFVIDRESQMFCKEVIGCVAHREFAKALMAVAQTEEVPFSSPEVRVGTSEKRLLWRKYIDNPKPVRGDITQLERQSLIPSLIIGDPDRNDGGYIRRNDGKLMVLDFFTPEDTDVREGILNFSFLNSSILNFDISDIEEGLRYFEQGLQVARDWKQHPEHIELVLRNVFSRIKEIYPDAEEEIMFRRIQQNIFEIEFILTRFLQEFIEFHQDVPRHINDLSSFIPSIQSRLSEVDLTDVKLLELASPFTIEQGFVE